MGGVIMALFKSKEEKEEKKQEKLDEFMSQFNLENLSQEDKKFAKLITYNLWGTGLIRFGASAEDGANIGLLRALIEQNWLIIKLLNEINSKLDK